MGVGSPRGSAQAPDRDDRIEDPQQIRDLLRDAAQARALCSVRPVGRPENYLARIIAFDESADALALEPPKAPYIERALAPGSSALIDVKDTERRSSFESRVLRIGPDAGETRLLLALPPAVVRPRRRESVRVPVPESVRLSLTLDAQTPGWRDLPVQNLSTSGLLVLLTGPLERFEPGASFDRVTMRLPNDRTFELALRVRHASAVRMAGQLAQLRVGMQFLRPPSGFEAAVAKLVEELASAADPRRGG
jgi:c-di-GMP-binding flagellar brake protein YcgR